MAVAAEAMCVAAEAMWGRPAAGWVEILVSNFYYVTKPPPANALHVGTLFPLSVATLQLLLLES